MDLSCNQARTAASGILAERQAEKTMIAQAYSPKENSNNYLHISMDAAELAIGDQMNINLNFRSGAQNQDLTYLVGISHIHIDLNVLVILWGGSTCITEIVML